VRVVYCDGQGRGQGREHVGGGAAATSGSVPAPGA
jgi:hypothetical protein